MNGVIVIAIGLVFTIVLFLAGLNCWVAHEASNRAKQDNDFYTKLWEENKAKRETGDASPYAGKESGEFVGD